MRINNVIIRGATGILGFEVCKTIVSVYNPENLILTGRNYEKLNKIKESLIKLKSKNTKIHVFDFEEEDLIAKTKFRNESFEIIGNTPDLLVIPMGLHKKSLPGTDLNSIRNIIDSNLTYPLESVLYWSGKKMKGQILFFADAALSAPFSGYSAYYAAKAGISSITETLAFELAPDIRVNGIAPGIMNLKPEAAEDAEDFWKKFVPLKKLGNPSFISKALEFLINEDYITGTILKVDGGLSVRNTKISR